MKTILAGLAVLALQSAAPGHAQLPTVPPYPSPDDRYKADILLVIGHPDDDSLIAGYLARAIFDEHKSVAVIVCTQGDGGGNEVNFEAGAALGQVRILEARRALGSLGIENIWFLGRHDTPSQNVLWSLDRWGHGGALDEVVRLVRLTRPEVMVTLLPAQVAGENHGDHQAAAVIATEAFDLAGDPTAYPEQVSAARDLKGISNLTEDLRPWQTKKIYYFTDAFEGYSQYWHDERINSPFRPTFLKGTGPEYSNATISPSRHVSYGRISAEELAYYLTQGGSLGKDAIAKGDFKEFEQPVHFIFGKSVVPSSVTGDIFEAVTPGAIPFVRVHGYEPETHGAVTLTIGDPWAFYHQFWIAHDIARLAQLVPVPELATDWRGTLHVPLLIHNPTPNTVEVTLTVTLPKGWTERSGSARYPLAASETYPAQSVVVAPASGEVGWQEITWSAETGGRQIGTVSLRVLVGKSGGLPQ